MTDQAGSAQLSGPSKIGWRLLNGRMAIVESRPGSSLAEHLRLTADAIETVEKHECKEYERVSHAEVEYEGGDGIWTTLLVIE